MQGQGCCALLCSMHAFYQYAAHCAMCVEAVCANMKPPNGADMTSQLIFGWWCIRCPNSNIVMNWCLQATVMQSASCSCCRIPSRRAHLKIWPRSKVCSCAVSCQYSQMPHICLTDGDRIVQCSPAVCMSTWLYNGTSDTLTQQAQSKPAGRQSPMFAR